MDDCKQLTDYLETILNLQCEHGEALAGLKQEDKELLQKVQEINARVAGLQMEVMEVQDALHPPAPIEEEPEEPSAPSSGSLLNRIGIAALLSPLLWNGVAAGVNALQGRAWCLDDAGAMAMAACICVAWGLLLIAVEPSLNRALDALMEHLEDSKTEEDEAIEEFLRRRSSKNDTEKH